MPAIVGQQLRRHRLEPAAVKQVQQQGLQDVVAVMTQRDLGRAQPAGVMVERAAAQPRAQAAHRLAGWDQPLDDAVGVLRDHLVADAERFEVLRQDVGRKPRLLLVEVDGHELEAHRRGTLQRQQQVEQRVGVLAAGQAHHDQVAVLDHRIVADGPAGQPAQLGLQPLERLRGPGLRHGRRRFSAARGTWHRGSAERAPRTTACRSPAG